MALWAASHDILWVQGASRFIGLFTVLPVLEYSYSISTYRLNNGIALASRKGTKQRELLSKLSYPGTDTLRSGDEIL